jgi:hypothetical protein
MSILKKPAALDTAGDATPRSTREKLLAMTPIVMTVVATILAGLSNSEMIKAQFYRALAAQNQSKAGDQWSYFQFKRARGTAHEMTVQLLGSLSAIDSLDADSLQAQADRYVRTLGHIETSSSQLVEKTKAAKALLASSYESVAAAADGLLTSVRTQRGQAGRWASSIREASSDPSVQQTLMKLVAPTPPKPEKTHAADIITDTQIRNVLHEIEQRKSERETEHEVGRISDHKLQEAIQSAEVQAATPDDALARISAAIDKLDAVLREQRLAMLTLNTEAQALRIALDDQPTPGELNLLATRLAAQSADLKSAAQAQTNAGTVARLRLEQRRYQREADENRVAAGLYEIQVRKSSWNSERHRTRSGYFFFGMLAAQAGVTISSLALAVRLKNLLWGVASCAGAAAIVIATYVYFYV